MRKQKGFPTSEPKERSEAAAKMGMAGGKYQKPADILSEMARGMRDGGLESLGIKYMGSSQGSKAKEFEQKPSAKEQILQQGKIKTPLEQAQKDDKGDSLPPM
jgi:hypothetical protein